MHSRELVELAALAAWHGPAFVASGTRLSVTGIEQYWTASKQRLDRWSRSLRALEMPAELDGPSPAKRWALVRPVIEEILAGEILTRVWTATVCSRDRRGSRSDAEPIARRVLIGHLEARYRALALLVGAAGVVTEEAVLVNRLRRRAERWTDLLLAHLSICSDVTPFCFDVQRVTEFADDLHSRGGTSAGRCAWSLTVASLHAAFRQTQSERSPNADVNERIAQSILACFPPELFDSTGQFHSLWTVRMLNTTNDAQGMLDELLRAEGMGEHWTEQPTARRRFGK